MARAKMVAQPAPASDDGRQPYRVAEGVAFINGQKVEGHTVRLTPAEALYDISLGRIAPEEIAADGRD